MKKSIFLFFAAILCAIGVQGANTMRIYCKQAQSWWKSDGAAVGAYYWGTGGNANSWPGTRMNKVSGQTDLWYIDVDIDKYQKIIFTRVPGSGTVSDWGAKTGDLTIANTKNQYTISSSSAVWGNPGVTGSWGTYKPTSTAALATSAANIFVGGQATLTSSLTSNADANTIKETAYAISPAGANVSGNTFTATAEGIYTVTATVTYYPLGCPTLTSTATAETTIEAEVPAEETHDVTVSYMCGETKLQDPTTVNTVGVEKSVKVTAPEIAKYTFVNWTLGADVATTDALTSNEINITTEAGGSDFTLVANYEKAKLTYTVTVPAGTENCYLVGAMNGWDEKNPYEMTKQGENVFTTTLEGVATTDEYKYISQKGTWDYEEVGGNRTWSANDVVTAWKDPLATNVYLAGEMNGWSTTANEFKKAAKDDASASIILNLTAGTYKFKVVDNGSWLGNNSTIDKTISGWTFAGDKGDCPLKATIAGDYTFTWAISTKKLSVTYPTICAITATANDAAMGTIAGAGDYGKGSTATLTATPNDGYLFVNWTKGGEVVATTQEYSFSVTEAVELVANFVAAPEEVHNVTVSYVCGGNKIADDQTVAAVGETTPKTAEAPEIWGYTFSSWTLGAGVTSTDATANPISINIVAGGSDYTLTANYTEIPKVTVYFVNNKKWSKVNAYGWKDGEAQGTPAWPGKDITASKETEQVADFDVYSYSVVPGSYDNIIFNNGSGTQTATFKWTDGKYYYMDAANNYTGGTKEEVAVLVAPDPLATGVYLAGDMTNKDNWDVNKKEFKKETAEATTASVTVTLAAQTYKFKLVVGGAWKGNTGIMQRGGVAVHEGGWSFDKDGYDDNCQIVADIAGDYTFTWNLETKKLTVSYPVIKVTPSVEKGIFSVDNGKFVQFSTGNLQYEVGTNTWSFAAEQYEVVGGATYDSANPTNTNYGMNEPGYTGKLDLFGWSSDGKFGVNPSNTDADYGTDGVNEFVDWGELVNETGWYTLTKEEMNYILNRKKDGKKLWALATVCGMNGLILLPDNWDTSITLDYGYVPANFNYTKNQIDDAAWQTLEDAGAVFLPEGGTRVGGHGNKDQGGGPDEFDAHYDYFHVDNVGSMGYYWLNTQDTRAEHLNCASFLILPGWSEGATNADDDDICLQPQVWSREKRRGNSVRLVKKVTPNYERTVTSGDYGTICLPKSGQLVGASAFSVAKMEGTTILLDEVGTTMVGGTPYVVFPNTGASNLYVFYTDNVEAPAGNANGLYGSYTREELAPNAGNYIMLPGNKYAEVTGDRVYVGENRAYFKVSEILTTAPAPAPGVRRIAIGQAPQVATGMENIDASVQPVKTIINGQLFILRGEKMYDAQGKLVK